MIVEVKVVGRPGEVVDREFAGLSGEVTLRALLTSLVRAEIAGYESRRQAQQLLSVLTPGDLATGHTSGRFVSGGHHTPPAPSADEAIDRALEAFTDGLYFVVLDGEQVTELDARVVVTPSSRLRLVRLVALAGG
ncbi:hypothetical protein HC028_01265 [Planosporangium flavigriseum]|uniref:Uncharacterized protein n=1 Tax=Planosporangium flavigriseum TaxID=373681 RepID=A0A8J3LJG2_9ACTN|nr:hypothetical protein [Planosporangium flavigriseum]NJC63148.1 hypothetical protein [Planosporangium flavigriseum]GIG72419.1 hypothetical protein Pfl04_08230 [Planosporangium flavigriseum]